MAGEPTSTPIDAASIPFGSLKIKWSWNIKEFLGTSEDYDLSSDVKLWSEEMLPPSISCIRAWIGLSQRRSSS